jgi:predicted transglutaminase-like cysteine proteinase
MFARVAAGGIAAFLLVMPAVSSGETNPLVDAPTQTGAVAITAPNTTEDRTPDQAQDQPRVQVLEQTTDQTQILLLGQPQQQTKDRTQILLLGQSNETGAAPVNLAALDPTEPSNGASATAEPAVRSPAIAEPFGLEVVPVAAGEILTKWSGVEAQIRTDSEILARCRANAGPCPSAARNFLAIVAQGLAQTGRARLGVINRAVNMAIRPMSDLAQWGVIDHWSPPLETFTTGAGDCEDYAIAKYVALTEAGIAADDVRLVIVRNLAANEDHAVVAARLDGNWIILDNRWLTLVNDNEMSEAVPLFVLDQTGVWRFTPTMAPDAHRASAPRQGVAIAPGSLDF